jgi:hypothetical protein
MERVAPSRSNFEVVLTHALAQWTTVDDIEKKKHHSMGLQLSDVDTWDGHEKIHSKLQFTDHTGEKVVLTLFSGDDTDFTNKNWDEDTWYFFTDLIGGYYNGDPQLTLSDESAVSELDPEYIPE